MLDRVLHLIEDYRSEEVKEKAVIFLMLFSSIIIYFLAIASVAGAR